MDSVSAEQIVTTPAFSGMITAHRLVHIIEGKSIVNRVSDDLVANLQDARIRLVSTPERILGSYQNEFCSGILLAKRGDQLIDVFAEHLVYVRIADRLIGPQGDDKQIGLQGRRLMGEIPSRIIMTEFGAIHPYGVV